MSATRFGRAQRITTLVPLALLSAAWTASLASVGPTSAVSSTTEEPSLPDGTSLPTEAIEAPASVSIFGSTRDVGGDPARIVAATSTSGIPAAALAAYQRAETVINSADATCNLTWQLVAAIGRVESNHGRFGGNRLDDDGVARPGILGIPLNGRNNTSSISDTDAGQYDSDMVWDRAVGPMQFIPSTWSVVGVDADSDGQRNPQDIDDAALATAVYLCSGSEDLSTTQGQRASVYRYNHSWSYVDLVLSIMDAYLAGDFMSIPNGTTSAGYFVPAELPAGDGKKGGKNGGKNGGKGSGGSGDGSAIAAPPPQGSSPDPGPKPNNPGPTPTPNNPLGGDGGGGGVKVPNNPGPTSLPTTGTQPLDQTLSEAEATTLCVAELGVLATPDQIRACVAAKTS